MPLTTERCLAAIEHHIKGFADAVRGNLDAPVEHCPGWSVADLVWHLTEVHWFWATIAEQRLTEPPSQGRPQRPADDALVAHFEAGAERMVHVLRAADQSARCWTWAPQQQDVAFITRHQVQEATVHHWDAAHAAGDQSVRSWWRGTTPDVAADCVEEFLTFSVSSDADPADPPRPALDGAIWWCACESEAGDTPTWLVTDGDVPGTVGWRRLPEGVEPVDVAGDRPIAGGHVDPAQVLLWLYGRVGTPWSDGPDGHGDPAVLDRLRALCFTD